MPSSLSDSIIWENFEMFSTELMCAQYLSVYWVHEKQCKRSKVHDIVHLKWILWNEQAHIYTKSQHRFLKKSNKIKWLAHWVAWHGKTWTIDAKLKQLNDWILFSNGMNCLPPKVTVKKKKKTEGKPFLRSFPYVPWKERKRMKDSKWD